MFPQLGPRRIGGDGTINLIKACKATRGDVNQFILISSLGTGKFGLPAGVLNLFWGVLIQKRRAELVLEEDEDEEERAMSWTIIRPGGMERPKDDFKLSHNLKLFCRDEIFGGQVSRLQVAELASALILDPIAAQGGRNQVIEVIAELDAPKTTIKDLLASFNDR